MSSSCSTTSTTIATPSVSRTHSSCHTRPSSPLIRTHSSATVATSSVMVLSSSMHGLTLLDKSARQQNHGQIEQQDQGGKVAAPADASSDMGFNSKRNTNNNNSNDPHLLPLTHIRRAKKVKRKPVFRIQQQQQQQARQLPVSPPKSQPQPMARSVMPQVNPIQRPNLPWTTHQLFWMDQGRCLISPVGSCGQQCQADSLYCILHACRATLADGTLCGGPVHQPRLSRVCKTGFHKENTRDLPAPSPSQEQTEDKERYWAETAACFRREFGETCSASPWYQADPGVPRPKPQLQRCMSDVGARERTREPVWGVYGDDRWWVGEWRFHQSAR